MHGASSTHLAACTQRRLGKSRALSLLSFIFRFLYSSWWAQTHRWSTPFHILPTKAFPFPSLVPPPYILIYPLIYLYAPLQIRRARINSGDLLLQQSPDGLVMSPAMRQRRVLAERGLASLKETAGGGIKSIMGLGAGSSRYLCLPRVQYSSACQCRIPFKPSQESCRKRARQASGEAAFAIRKADTCGVISHAGAVIVKTAARGNHHGFAMIYLELLSGAKMNSFV